MVFQQMTTNLDLALAYFDKAEKLLQDNEVLNKELYLGQIMMLRASVCYDSEELDRGFEYLKKAEDHAMLVGDRRDKCILLGDIYNSEGSLCSKAKDKTYDDAIECYSKSYEYFVEILGEENHTVAVVLSNMGRMYIKYDEAERCLLQSMNIEKNLYGEEHPNMLFRYSHYGEFLCSIGRYEEAKEMNEKALEMSLRFYGQNSKITANQYSFAAYDYCYINDYKKAELYLKNACNIYDELFGISYGVKISCIWQIADIYFEHCNYKEALSHYLEIVPLIESNSKKDGNDKRVGNINYDIANAYYELGSPLATEYYEKAMNLFEKCNNQEMIDIIKNKIG